MIDIKELERITKFEAYLRYPERYSPTEYLVIWAFASHTLHKLAAEEIVTIVDMASSSRVQVSVESIQRACNRFLEQGILKLVDGKYEIGD